MNQDDFTQALTIALSDGKLRKSLVELVSRAAGEPIVQKVSESIKREVESLKNEVVLLRAELRNRDKKIQDLEAKVDSLAAEVDSLEQYSRRNSMRIAGIPETVGEDTPGVLINILNNDLKLDPPLVVSELDRVHRVGKPSSNPARPRSILVKLATYRSRKRVMDLRPKLRETSWFFNEDLTKRRDNLLYQARRMKSEHKIKGAWSADGNILVRDKSDIIRKINNENELKAL